MVKTLVWQLWPSTNQTPSVVQLAVVMGFLHSNGRFVADVSNPTYQPNLSGLTTHLQNSGNCPGYNNLSVRSTFDRFRGCSAGRMNSILWEEISPDKPRYASRTTCSFQFSLNQWTWIYYGQRVEPEFPGVKKKKEGGSEASKPTTEYPWRETGTNEPWIPDTLFSITNKKAFQLATSVRCATLHQWEHCSEYRTESGHMQDRLQCSNRFDL
jgi:hypothetical protein